MIMGRKTYDSFGSKPLPNRFHIVISHQFENHNINNAYPESVIFLNNFESAKSYSQNLINAQNWSTEVMIIGGAEIYKLTLPEVSKIYLTQIHNYYEGDTFYPNAYLNSFCKTASRNSEFSNPLTFEIWEKSI